MGTVQQAITATEIFGLGGRASPPEDIDYGEKLQTGGQRDPLNCVFNFDMSLPTIPSGETVYAAKLLVRVKWREFAKLPNFAIGEWTGNVLESQTELSTAFTHIGGGHKVFQEDVWVSVGDDITLPLHGASLGALAATHIAANTKLWLTLNTTDGSAPTLDAGDIGFELFGDTKPAYLLLFHEDNMADPFTQVNNAFWDLLEANAEFAAAVPVGNRIKTAEGAPRELNPDTLSESDTPFVRILQTGSEPLTHASSSSSFCIQKIEIQVFSGSQLFHVKHNPVKWAIFRALADWTSTLYGLLLYTRKFVHLLKPVSTETELEDRGILGWTSVWACEVHMNFRRADMLTGPS